MALWASSDIESARDGAVRQARRALGRSAVVVTLGHHGRAIEEDADQRQQDTDDEVEEVLMLAVSRRSLLRRA
jgi:hypothetical protein